MPAVCQRWIAVAALLGATGVALGAYGAHGLSGSLERWGYAGDDLAHRVDIFHTAVRYQMIHALALVALGLALVHGSPRAWHVAAWAMLGGVLVFSGLLYALALAGPDWKWVGAVVPFGGGAMIVGWLALAVGALSRNARPPSPSCE